MESPADMLRRVADELDKPNTHYATCLHDILIVQAVVVRAAFEELEEKISGR